VPDVPVRVAGGRPGLRALVAATHPAPAAAVTVVATLLAVAAGIPAWRTGLLFAAVLAGQASIGWSNDWLDADRDRAVARGDKPVVQGAVRPAQLRVAALLALALAVVLSFLLGLAPGLLLLLLVAGGWAYNAGLKRTWASWVGYVVGFGALPAGVVAAAPGGPAAPWWLVFAGGALGAAAHLANVAPDLEDDLATGVRGLPHRLGPRVSAVSGALLLGAASVVLVTGPPGPPTTVGWTGLALAAPAVVVAALAHTARFRRLAFPAVMLLTVLDVVLLLAGGASLR
jgi:4-hydroxybenzoate polyprenyltransferase